MENKRNKTKNLIIGCLFLIILLVGGYFAYQYFNAKECEKCETCDENEDLRIFSIGDVVYFYTDSAYKPETKTYIQSKDSNLVVGEFVNGVDEEEGLEEFGCISSDKSNECLGVQNYEIISAEEDSYVLIFDLYANIYKIKLSDYLSVEKKSNYNAEVYNNKKATKFEMIDSCTYDLEGNDGYWCDELGILKITYSDGTIENIDGILEF